MGTHNDPNIAELLEIMNRELISMNIILVGISNILINKDIVSIDDFKQHIERAATMLADANTQLQEAEENAAILKRFNNIGEA